MYTTAPRSDFCVSTFFASEFARQRFKIGVPHIGFYSSWGSAYNSSATDQVTHGKFFLTFEVTITKKIAVPTVQLSRPVLLALPNYRVACGTAKTVLGKFLKAKSGVPTKCLQTTSYELPSSGHVLKQSTFPALKQIAIAGKKSQGAGLFLHVKQARSKLANVVQPPAHFLFAALRLERYGAGDSATSVPFLLFAGSKTTRTRACNTLATRRSILKEWPS